MVRKPCQYCKTEDGVDRLGIGFSGRCGAHYYRPAFPPEVEAPEQLYEEIVQMQETPPVEPTPEEGLTLSMFP